MYENVSIRPEWSGAYPSKPARRWTGRQECQECLPYSRGSAVCALDFIKHSPLVEVSLLRFLPTAKDLVDGEQVSFGECRRVLLCHRVEPRAIKVLCCEFLSLRRI